MRLLSLHFIQLMKQVDQPAFLSLPATLSKNSHFLKIDTLNRNVKGLELKAKKVFSFPKPSILYDYIRWIFFSKYIFQMISNVQHSINSNIYFAISFSDGHAAFIINISTKGKIIYAPFLFIRAKKEVLNVSKRNTIGAFQRNSVIRHEARKIVELSFHRNPQIRTCAAFSRFCKYGIMGYLLILKISDQLQQHIRHLSIHSYCKVSICGTWSIN